MSKLNVILNLNAYNDKSGSNNPSQSFFKWNREVLGYSVNDAKSQELVVAPGASVFIFDGQVSLSHNNTTNYSLTLKPNSSNTYILTHTSGTAPAFRTARSIATDATSSFVFSFNGKVVTLTNNAGTAPDFSSVIIGDKLKLAAPFNTFNQGTFTIIAKTSNSISYVNSNQASETVILGVDYLPAFQIYSSAGVQIGNKLEISSVFSPASWGTYDITEVTASTLEFYSTASLPQEYNILGSSGLNVYSSSKQFVYLEADNKIGLLINNQASGSVEPFISPSGKTNGMFMVKRSMFNFQLSNDGLEPATIIFMSVE
jgi:hypothetical protein